MPFRRSAMTPGDLPPPATVRVPNRDNLLPAHAPQDAAFGAHPLGRCRGTPRFRRRGGGRVWRRRSAVQVPPGARWPRRRLWRAGVGQPIRRLAAGLRISCRRRRATGAVSPPRCSSPTWSTEACWACSPGVAAPGRPYTRNPALGPSRGRDVHVDAIAEQVGRARTQGGDPRRCRQALLQVADRRPPQRIGLVAHLPAQQPEQGMAREERVPLDQEMLQRAGGRRAIGSPTR